MQLRFRRATHEDCRHIYNLYMNAEANAYLAYDLMTEAEFDILYEKLLSGGSLMIAELDEAVAGSYHVYEKEYRQSDTVFLATLVVDPSFKRRGIAKAMVQHIIHVSREQRKNRIELEVSVSNTDAIALYEKMGFEKEGVVRQSYRIGQERVYYDDYRMSVLL